METNPQNQSNTPATQSSERGLDAGIIFGSNHHFAFIFKKTEKLVAAVYLITDFIKDNEPIKWSIRENAIALMSINVAFGTAPLSERKSLIKDYQSMVLEIVSLSNIAQHAGLISEMNFRVLSREFNNVINLITGDENKKANEQTVVLDPGFFASEENKPSEHQVSQQISHKGHSVSIKDIQEKPVQSIQSPRLVDRATPPKDDKDTRRTAITKLLAKKSGLSIKDFGDSIKGVSEKTIQRELLAMVALGLIKKEGERRWSTYSLAN